MFDTHHLIEYVCGGTLGFLLVALIFVPLRETIALGLLLLSVVYLLSGVVLYRFWNVVYPE